MASTLAAPKLISPFIRFWRYTAVLSGFMYGAYHMKRFTSNEIVIQEHNNKLKAIRDVRLKQEKKVATALEMEQLAVQFGVGPTEV